MLARRKLTSTHLVYTAAQYSLENDEDESGKIEETMNTADIAFSLLSLYFIIIRAVCQTQEKTTGKQH